MSARVPVRVPSHEGLDDVEVVAAFARVSAMPQMRLLRSYVVRRVLHLAKEGKAADLGCGDGRLAVDLARRAPGLSITGVDLSSEMLSEARGRARHGGLGSRVSFREGDVGRLPFTDNSLDLVVSTLSLHHWRDPVVALDEIDRVLRPPDPLTNRPGSAFVVFDLRRDVALPASALLAFATRFVVPAALRRINEPMASRNAAYTPEEAMRFASRSRLTGWQVKVGPLWLILEGRIAAELRASKSIGLAPLRERRARQAACLGTSALGAGPV